MATKKPQQKSVLSQLQSVGEGAIEKITQNPATRSALQGAMNLRDRGEQLVTGLVAIEKRLVAVEKRLARARGAGEARDHDRPHGCHQGAHEHGRQGAHDRHQGPHDRRTSRSQAPEGPLQRRARRCGPLGAP